MRAAVSASVAVLLTAALAAGDGAPGTTHVRTELKLLEACVGCWNFDERAGGAKDLSARRNDGELLGRPARVPGRFGGALKFKGEDDAVRLRADLAPWLGRTAALAFWIKSTQAGSADVALAPAIAGDANSAWGWIDADGRIGLKVGRAPSARSSAPVNDGRWHHVVLMRQADTGLASVFVDGRADGTEYVANGDPGGLIRDLGSREGADPFSGALDEVRVFSRLLSVRDIDVLLRGGDRPVQVVERVQRPDAGPLPQSQEDGDEEQRERLEALLKTDDATKVPSDSSKPPASGESQPGGTAVKFEDLLKLTPEEREKLTPEQREKLQAFERAQEETEEEAEERRRGRSRTKRAEPRAPQRGRTSSERERGR